MLMIFVDFVLIPVAHYAFWLFCWASAYRYSPTVFDVAQATVSPTSAAVWIALSGYGIYWLLQWVYDSAGYRSAGAKSSVQYHSKR